MPTRCSRPRLPPRGSGSSPDHDYLHFEAGDDNIVVVQGKNIKLDQETNSTASLRITNCQIKILENAAENHLVVHDRIHEHCQAVFGENLVLRIHMHENNDGRLIMININNVLSDFAYIKHPLN